MSTLDRWIFDAELAILRTNRYPAGADAVLQVLVEAWRRGAGREEDGWVGIDEISALTGQRAVHSRIAELRTRGIAILHNGRAGGRSMYRLTEAP